MNSDLDDVSRWRARAEEAIDEGDLVEARRCIERVWELRPGAANALFVERHRAALSEAGPLRRLSVSILRSFTVEPVVPLLRAQGLLHGLDIDVRVGEFNTYAQELFDPTNKLVYGARVPDVVIVATQARDIAPDLWSDFADLSREQIDAATDRVIAEFTAMVETFRENSDSSLLLHGLQIPPRPALGLADHGSEAGQVAAFERMNAGLRTLSERLRGIYFVDVDRLVARLGVDNWHDDAKWIQMKMPLRSAAMPVLAAEWLRFLIPLSGLASKALVVDLDNTLWGGVVGEVGREGVEPDPESVVGAGFLGLQRSLLDLKARGVLLAICSKNNYDDAIEVLERGTSMQVRPADFATMRINWDSKVDNLKSIAAELNIGLDALAFLDDSPAECDQVRRMLPEVTVIELYSPPRPDWNPVAGHPRFERLRLSDEDRSRSEMYGQQRSREDLRSATASLDDYLHALQTKVEIVVAGTDDTERIAQLTQKTNQCNLTTRRYSVAEIERMQNADATEVLVVRASDRFGDHGVIGVSITKRIGDRAEIDSFLLSCRVIGRGVEVAMLAAISQRSRHDGAVVLEGAFVPTAKNAPAAGVYPDSGFVEVADDNNGDGSRWRLDMASADVTIPRWIECTIEGDVDR